MAPNPFIAPAVAQSIVLKLRHGVTKVGGEADLLSKLWAGNDDAFDEIIAGGAQERDMFVRMLDEPDFRAGLLDVLDPADAGFLGDLLAAIELWRSVRPASYQVVRSQILGSPINPLSSAIPSQANDISRVYTIISSDTLGENLRVKCAMRLIRPDKSLGGDDVFVISASLTSFIYSIAMMIRSLIKTDSERGVVTVSLANEEKSTLYSALEFVEGQVKELRTQTERMVGPKPSG